MSEDSHAAPHRRSTDQPAGVCAVHELQMSTMNKGIEAIQADAKETRAATARIEKTLGEGNAVFENLRIRMDHVESCVYGALGAAGLALIAAILGLVLKNGG